MKKPFLFKLLFGLVLFIPLSLLAQPSNDSSDSFSSEIIDSLYSQTLNEQRTFWVKLPDDYTPDNGKKYPVIYLLDGFSLKQTLQTVYENYWGHYFPQMILVGISNSANRTRDLTISKVNKWNSSEIDENTGGAEDFSGFINKELIPYIDRTFPTTNYRTLIGHSYAGLFTVNMLLNQAPLFKNYIAIDPTLDWDGQLLLKQAREKLKTEKFPGQSLFVSLAGEQLHMRDEKITLENIMQDSSEFSLFSRSIIEFSTIANSQKQNELNFAWKFYPEDLHGTVPLPSMIDGLVFGFKWFQFISPQSYNNPETPIEEIETLLDQQEKIYTHHFGYPMPPMIEEMLNGYGYMFLFTDQAEKAHLFFSKSIAYFPKSANSYDSMAEYYQLQNDPAKALTFYEKAYEISGKKHHLEKIEDLKEEILKSK